MRSVFGAAFLAMLWASVLGTVVPPPTRESCDAPGDPRVLDDVFYFAVDDVTLTSTCLGPGGLNLDRFAEMDCSSPDYHLGSTDYWILAPDGGGALGIDHQDKQLCPEACGCYEATCHECDENGDCVTVCPEGYGCDGHGNCYELVYGCIEDESACNYDPAANTQTVCVTCTSEQYCSDMQCYDHVYGCRDSNACNYDASATRDATCNICDTSACYSCREDGNCLYDCDEDTQYCHSTFGCTDHVDGCMDPTACNYNPLADRDPQNECVHCDSSACFGCSVDGLSCDYECDGEAGETCEEGGVCHILGCSNSDACNYDAAATMDDGSCHTCDTANCMVCDGEDSCTFACTGDEVCDGEGSCVIYGCTFAFACNYNPAATADDLSCNICAADSCLVCDGAVDPSNDNECVSSCSGDEVCHNDQCHIEGCTDSTACNYDPTATWDDGSCNICGPCSTCDGDQHPSNTAPCVTTCANDEVCHDDVCAVEGCTDPNACNYLGSNTMNNRNTWDDGSCEICVGCQQCNFIIKQCYARDENCAAGQICCDEIHSDCGEAFQCVDWGTPLGPNRCYRDSQCDEGYKCESALLDHDYDYQGRCFENDVEGGIFCQHCDIDEDCLYEGVYCVGEFSTDQDTIPGCCEPGPEGGVTPFCHMTCLEGYECTPGEIGGWCWPIEEEASASLGGA